LSVSGSDLLHFISLLNRKELVTGKRGKTEGGRTQEGEVTRILKKTGCQKSLRNSRKNWNNSAFLRNNISEVSL